MWGEESQEEQAAAVDLLWDREQRGAADDVTDAAVDEHESEDTIAMLAAEFDADLHGHGPAAEDEALETEGIDDDFEIADMVDGAQSANTAGRHARAKGASHIPCDEAQMLPKGVDDGLVGDRWGTEAWGEHHRVFALAVDRAAKLGLVEALDEVDLGAVEDG